MATHESSALWYAQGLHFTCTLCGNCCSGAAGYVYVSDEEVAAIATHLGENLIEFTNRRTRRVGKLRSLLEHDNGDCDFLDTRDDGKRVCGIYAVRPVQCRTWPFWASNVSSQRSWDAAARGCPGMNQGRHHPLPVIQTALARNSGAGLKL